jgi:predicted metal-dependent hydrolase
LEAESAHGSIPFTIRRSARARRSRLTITDAGVPLVVLPLRAPESDAVAFVARHHAWVNRHVARIHARREALAARPGLDAGREILFHATPHRVVSIAAIDGRRRASVRVIDGGIVVISPLLDGRSTAELLEGWLRAEARRELTERVTTRASEMAITPSRVTVRDQRTRWGSASRRGTLSFSWRLVMCPPHVLDYVVVHELAHVRVAGHSKAFWRLVDRHFPVSRGARTWLRAHHDEVRRALD